VPEIVKSTPPAEQTDSDACDAATPCDSDSDSVASSPKLTRACSAARATRSYTTPTSRTTERSHRIEQIPLPPHQTLPRTITTYAVVYRAILLQLTVLSKIEAREALATQARGPARVM
jgi:hypothetical protein